MFLRLGKRRCPILPQPWASLKQSGGTYTPCRDPRMSWPWLKIFRLVGVDYVQVVNQTTGQKATHLRLAADGFFSSAVPVAEGRNQIDVFARASDGSTRRDSVSVFISRETNGLWIWRSFSKEKKISSWKLNAWGRSPAEIQKETEKSREDGLGRSQRLAPSTEGPPR